MVCAQLLERAEAFSERMVDQLINDGAPVFNPGPCLIGLAGRVQCVHNEAVVASFSSLPPYAVEMLQIKAEAVQQDEFVQLSSPQPTSQLNIDTAQESPQSPSKEQGIISRKASTPVRCNKTPTVESSRNDGHGLDLASQTARVLTWEPLSSGQNLTDESQEKQSPQTAVVNQAGAFATTSVAERPAGLKKPPELISKKTTADSSELASQAHQLLVEGRKHRQNKPQLSQASIADLALPSLVDPSDNTTNTHFGSAETKSSESKVGDVDVEAATLFGDANEMPSPIKPEEGWDWTDEW
jgi:hypothetical protein